MKIYFYILLFVLLNMIQLKVHAQDPVIDSLKFALKNAKHDKVKCSILSELAETASEDEWPAFNEQLVEIAKKNLKLNHDGATRSFYIKQLATGLNNKAVFYQMSGNNKDALIYFSKSLQYCKEINEKEGIANALYNIGILYDLEENSSRAIDYLSQALVFQKEIKDQVSVASSLDNLGTVYAKIGNIDKAIDLFHQSLKIREGIDDQAGLAKSLMSLGNFYSNEGNTDKALLYYNKSLKISEGINNQVGISNAYHNISTAYLVLKDYPKAIDYCEKSQKINKALNDYNGVAADIVNMGYIYKNQGNLSMALQSFLEALRIYEKINNKENIAYSLSYVVDLYTNQNKLEIALEYAKKNLLISKELGYPYNINTAAYLLKRIYKKQKKYQEALDMYELEIQMRDSINNDNNKKASIKQQLKYEYEKQAAADSVKHAEEQKVKNAQLEVQAASLKQEKTQRYVLYGGLLLVIGFSAFVFNRFKVTQKQKKVIEEQKVLVDKAYEQLHEKNKEVLDSITYARRIQRALITSERYIDKTLNRLNNKS